MVSTDLEKAYDRLPRKAFKWAFMRKDVLKMYLNFILKINEKARVLVSRVSVE